MLRRPVVAGSFYPNDALELKRMLKKFFDGAKVRAQKSKGAVVPHAGYIFSGQTAAYVYKSLPDMNGKTFVILCPSHTGMGEALAVMPEGSWETPLGSVEVDENLAKKILSESALFKGDTHAHLYEHSIEVQLPFLQYRFGKFKIVPIAVSGVLSGYGTAEKIGLELSESIKDEYIIASSDLTHYGYAYGYAPFSGGGKEIIKKIRKMDGEIIRNIEKLNVKGFSSYIDDTQNTTCGAAPIMIMLRCLKERGAKKAKLLNYSTSYDATRDTGQVVGYAGMIVV